MNDLEKAMEMVKDVGILRGAYDEVCRHRNSLEKSLTETRTFLNGAWIERDAARDQAQRLAETGKWLSERLHSDGILPAEIDNFDEALASYTQAQEAKS